MDLDCEICLEELDGAARVPKVLPCGHSVCLRCLRASAKRECPTCRTAFGASPETLPHNYALLRVAEQRGDTRLVRDWCFDCRAAAARRCWDEHETVGTRTALRRQLGNALPQACRRLEGLPGQLQEHQTLQALELLDADAWDVTLRRGDRVVSGTLRDTEDPLSRALLVILAAKLAATDKDHHPSAAPSVGPSRLPRRPSLSRAQGPLLTPAPPHEHTPLCDALLQMSLAPSALFKEAHRERNEQDTSLTEQHSRVKATLLNALRRSAPRRWEMEVGILCSTKPTDRKQEKALALQDAQEVKRLIGVSGSICWDPDWSLELLKSAAASVEELHLNHPSDEHLRTLASMPRLRRLHVWRAQVAVEEHAGKRRAPPPPPVLGAAPGAVGLCWLTTANLPLVTLRSLLQAHGHTLRVLQLLVGTDGPSPWPMASSDLPALLEHCGLHALRRLVLRRRGCCHERAACVEQLSALHRALPRGADVLCETCDRIEFEKF